MEITFLIGNGFDLNCGLKSSYQDVYKKYCEIDEKKDSELIKKFKKIIREDGYKNNYKNWSDFEWSMAENINMFETENDFIECLTNFQIYLNKYLKQEEQDFIARYKLLNIKQNLKEEIKKNIHNFYEDVTNFITNDVKQMIKDDVDIEYNFIVFNYTRIFKTMIDLLGLNITKKIIHIHGTLENKDTILGIDNEPQLQLKSFQLSDRGRISFIKPFFNNKYDFNRLEEAKESIYESDIICVYGMSLGKTDLTWKNLIVKWLELEQHGHLFIYDYDIFKENKNIELKTIQYTKEESLKRKYMLEKLKIDNSNSKYNSCFNKIHIPFKNIFNIKEIVEKAESEKKDNELKYKIEADTLKKRMAEIDIISRQLHH